MAWARIGWLAWVPWLLAGCVGQGAPVASAIPPIALEITQSAPERIAVRYHLARPAHALHFGADLGGYRAEAWEPANPGYRWVKEPEGERIERLDGRPFDALSFAIPIDYRALPKRYAPFSPFSTGGALVHSGQFHACPTAPCAGTDPLPIAIRAPGLTIGVEGRRTRDADRFVSREEGTSIFLGTLEPVAADGFVAIVDPGLPPAMRAHLSASLPRAIGFFAARYGPLSFTPELYVSVDDRREARGQVSSQGGTLPGQIFMHFDGEGVRDKLAGDSPFWLDWFFAHEAAHLVQQDRIGYLAGDATAPWLHEGGADAMAALALADRGGPELAYARTRVAEAEAACATGLNETTLPAAIGAGAAGDFDLHYRCGMVFWLALDTDLRARGKDGLDALNRAFFARVKDGAAWDMANFLATAQELGASPAIVARIRNAGDVNPADAAADIAALGALARIALAIAP